jgi:ketosteroid isomerase-like protein
MTDAPARETALRLFEAMNARDTSRLSGILAPEAVFHFPGTDPIAGPEAIARFLGILWRRFPELAFRTGRVIAEGESAAVEWTNEGKDRKGAPYRNAGVTVLELKDGKIVYLSDTFKDTAAFRR